MTKKTIVHIAQSNGGVGRYLKNFFKYSRNEKYTNILIASQDYIDSVASLESLGVKVYIVEMCREISLRKDIQSMLDIGRILKKINPDIIYCHSSKAGVYGRVAALFFNIKSKCIYNPHGWSFDMKVSNLKKWIFILIEQLLSFLTDNIVAISNHEKEVALKYSIINRNKISVIENGIDLDFINQTVEGNIISQIGWDKNDTIIGMVGRISEQKSPETFVKIAENIIQKIESSKFILVGDGEQRDIIENMIREKGLVNRFHITGWIENPEAYISIFDVALLTSKWEGFGLVIPEYMCLKIPVIASKVGGIADIIKNNETGYLVECQNIDEFAEAILELTTNKEKRKNIIDAAYDETITRFDFRRVVSQHTNLFKRLEE